MKTHGASLATPSPALRDTLGRAWVLPLVGAAGILVAITPACQPISQCS
jgi:hypothetical protein